MRTLGRLFLVAKAFIPILILTVFFGLFGFISAHGITVLAAIAMMKYLGVTISISYTLIFILMVVCGVLRGVLRYAEHLTGHYTAFKMLAAFRNKLFLKLQLLAPARLEDKEKGNLISLITSDVETLEIFYAHTIAPLTIYLLHSALMFTVFTLFSSWFLGLVALLAYFIIGMFIPFTIGKKTKKYASTYRTLYSGFASTFMDYVAGSNDLISLGQSTKTSATLTTQSMKVEKTNQQFKYAISNLKSVTDLMIYLFIIIFLGISLLFFHNGHLPLPQLILSFVLFIGSFGPSLALGALPGTLSHTLSAGQRVLNLLDEKPIVSPVTDGKDIKYNGVLLNDVSFAYADQTILKSLTYHFKPGTIYGIHADSGSGKSTLLKLLMRFWDAKSGSIMYDGVNIAEINTSSLHQNISYMTQDTYIFNMTLKENVVLAGNYQDEQIAEAIKKAHLETFISELSQGLDTKAGELGSRLSGGEKQRLGLARIFLYGGDLVLLDEPTSNVDALSEAAILAAVKELGQTKTVIMVSHRPSTLTICDVILSFKDGHLVEQ